MPERKIDERIFAKFVSDAGWMEIYYEPTYNLIRYITPSGIMVDTIHEDNWVSVRLEHSLA